MEKEFITIPNLQKALAEKINLVKGLDGNKVRPIKPEEIGITRNFETGEWDVREWLPTYSDDTEIESIVADFKKRYLVKEG